MREKKQEMWFVREPRVIVTEETEEGSIIVVNPKDEESLGSDDDIIQK